MVNNNEKLLDDRDNHSKPANNDTPKAYRVEDENDLNEESLERSLYGDSKDNVKRVMEGSGMGGQNFGKNNNTPSGDDKNNPSQTAGNTNPYFARTEPSKEHPEDSNFKVETQDGQPDYSAAQSSASSENQPKPEKTESGNGENDRPHEEEPYTEGTADNESEPNVHGYNELPDQQKVGEKTDEYPDDKDHVET